MLKGFIDLIVEHDGRWYVADYKSNWLGVDELAEQDSEVADYVRTLEEAKDAMDLPEASGDAIAREFERYFRRHGGAGES